MRGTGYYIILCIVLITLFQLALSTSRNSVEKKLMKKRMTVVKPTCGNGRRGNGHCPQGLCCTRAGWCVTNERQCEMSMMKKATPAGFVYAGTNDPVNNEVVAYERDHNGYLIEMGRYETGGLGFRGALNDPLTSQYSLVRTSDAKHILYVNGGSDTFSVFRRESDGSLNLTDIVSSEPSKNSSVPASLTINGNLVYVLNSGNLKTPAGVVSISGFRANWATGKMTYIAGSTRTFDGGFGQLAFTPDGRFLVAVGRTTDQFLTFSVNSSGLPSAMPVISRVTMGYRPFSLVWSRTGHVAYLSLAFGGVGSYSIDNQGRMSPVQELNTTSAAACWIVRYRNSDVFYVVNAGKPSIGAFRATERGTFTQIPGQTRLSANVTDDDTYVFAQGSVPLDATITLDGQFLYVLLGGRGRVAAFAINQVTGLLMSRGEFEFVPHGYNGINGITST